MTKIREFNRFYLPALELLGNHYLQSEYSVTEARIFYELYVNPGCTAASIARGMHLDKSYLSRILKAHEKNGYLYKTPSAQDARSFQLYLTEQGSRRAEAFIQRSNQQIAALIQPLSPAECGELSAALECVMRMLRKCGQQEGTL